MFNHNKKMYEIMDTNYLSQVTGFSTDIISTLNVGDSVLVQNTEYRIVIVLKIMETNKEDKFVCEIKEY